MAVSGLAAGEQLIGIDRRPKTGVLYGVGKLGTAGRLFTVDPTTGRRHPRRQPGRRPHRRRPPGGPIALSGTEFGFDFNPMADALRIVSDTGQNLRVIPSDRMPATGPALLTATRSPTAPSTPTAPPATGVSAAAYTNNVAGRHRRPCSTTSTPAATCW